MGLALLIWADAPVGDAFGGDARFPQRARFAITARALATFRTPGAKDAHAEVSGAAVVVQGASIGGASRVLGAFITPVGAVLADVQCVAEGTGRRVAITQPVLNPTVRELHDEGFVCGRRRPRVTARDPRRAGHQGKAQGTDR
jgi:hypothetical protein